MLWWISTRSTQCHLFWRILEESEGEKERKETYMVIIFIRPYFYLVNNVKLNCDEEKNQTESNKRSK